jgi:hypothetical protein
MSDSGIDDLKVINNAQKAEINELRAQIRAANENERITGSLIQSNMLYGQAFVHLTWQLLRSTPKSNVQKLAVCYHEITDLFDIVKQYCASTIPFPELVLPNQILAALNIAGFNLHPVEKSNKHRGQIIGINDHILI